MALFEVVDRAFKFAPCGIELCEDVVALGCEDVVFAWWSLGALLPFVREESVVFEACEQRVERTLDYEQVGFLKLGNDVARVTCLLTEEKHDAVFEHAFAHL